MGWAEDMSSYNEQNRFIAALLGYEDFHECGTGWRAVDLEGTVVDVPDFYGSISAAWRLVKVMGQDFRALMQGKKFWHARVWQGGMTWIEHGTTAMQAICKAFITWKREDRVAVEAKT